MKDDSILYWLWLSERCGVASTDFGRLITRFESPYDLYRLEDEELEQLEGIDERLKRRLSDKDLDFAYRTRYECSKMGISVIPYGDSRYPKRLRELKDPPVLLYVMGELPVMEHRLCIGMVGTRSISEYGRESAYKISYELASAYAVVVSGMALGVDGVCAAGALAAGGSTVAVLGCGLSVVYPKEHARLMRAIARNGAVISEYPPATRPFGGNFPKRNRIISGLCQGVFVVEGAKGSGALITAARASEQGRDVFALPGKIDDCNSEGPNELIKDGAIPVVSTEDILGRYDFLYHERINFRGLNEARKNPYPMEAAMSDYGVSDSSDRIEIKQRPPVRKPVGETVTEKKKVPESHARLEKAPEVKQETAAVCMDGLEPEWVKVMEAMPVGQPVSADTLTVDGISTADVITAMTMLEINGICEGLPGGMFLRK